MKHDDARANDRVTNTITDNGNVLTTRNAAAAQSQGRLVTKASTNCRYVMAGARIKHYTILHSLGRGGTGEVFLAMDTKLDRLVALKRPFLRNVSHVERLLAEARVLARLQHENIAVVYEVNQFLGHPFMVFEYIEGQTLRYFMRQEGPSVRVALQVIIPVVRALVHFHKHDVVHRDLKPENIMVAATGAIKVIDFGAAELSSGPECAVVSKQKRAKPLAPMGTLAYMSPEQIRADKVDHRTDIWAVGIVLHELTWGEHPLAPFGPGWIRSLFEFDVPLPQSIGSPEASALANVITQCLKKRRDERMATAEELLAVLEKIADDARSPAYHVSSNA